MSNYTLQLCDVATGARTAILPDFLRMQISFEMSDVGSLQVDYPKQGINYDLLSSDSRIEVAVLKDGVEMDDARYRIQSVQGDEVKDDDIPKFVGVSLLNRFKKAIVYSADGSTSAATDQTFNNATPGGILQALFQQNFDRGSGTVCRELTWNSFTNAVDSAGDPWAFTFGTITYTVGVNYLDVIRNMVDNGMIEVRMVGRDLQVFNAGGLGTDHTIVSDPVVLRKGLDFMEAPLQKTNEQVAAVALIQGDEGVLLQSVDSSVATAWGRDEVYISQGGIKDQTTLGVVAQSTLQQMSEVRAERTRKLAVHGSRWEPYTDYRVSDYVYNDSANGAGLERLRIRQLVMEIDQNGIQTASLVLNDKFLEREIALARKVSGILGGANAGGSVAIPVPIPPDVGTDITIPKAPAAVSAGSNVYVNEAGRSVSQASVAWSAVTQNTDNSVIADLDHYDLQWHSDEVFATTPPTSLTPGRELDSLTRKFDRRGKGYGWVAGDGGHSCRATSGKDFWLFADTYLGVADQKGKIVSNQSFIHNSAVYTDVNNTGTFDAKWAYGNRLSKDDAWLETTVGNWQADTNCSVVRSTSTFYYGTASLQVTATAAGDATARIAAAQYANITAGTTYSVMARARSVGTARQVALGIRWYNASNALISTSTMSNTAGSNSAWVRYVHSAVAPANAVKASIIIIFRSAGAAQVFNADAFMLCQGDARYGSWNDPVRGTTGPMSLICPEELGGAAVTAPTEDDILWVDACATVGSKIIGFMPRFTSSGTFKNSVCIAQWDGTTHQFESLTVFTTSDNVQWGSTTWADGTYLYVFGVHMPNSADRFQHLMRVPLANVTGGTKEFWSGTTWTTTRASSSPVYTAVLNYIGGITQIGSTFHAVVTTYGSGVMTRLTAPAITGPYTNQGAFYTQPEMGSGLFAYFPRIHRQLESNAGIPMSYSVNGSVNGIGPSGNVKYYTPKFLIGPPATLAAAVPSTPWSSVQTIPAGTEVAYIGDIAPGSNFQVRVRAADFNGNKSAWTTSTPIRTTEDTNPPNRPSTPIMTAAFKGVRIEWDGQDFQGGPPPGDWSRTEVHLSEVSNFTPGTNTLVDTFYTRVGGVSPIQGLEYGHTYYARFVMVDVRNNRSDPSDVASVVTERIVDIDDIADKLITGAKIADGSIAVKNLTVAAFEPNILPNGNFEDEATDATNTPLNRPSYWQKSFWQFGSGATDSLETVNPIAGNKSLKLSMATDADGQRYESVKFAVVGGKLLALSARVRASRNIAGTVFQVHIITGVTQSDVGTLPSANSNWGTPTSVAATTSVQTIEMQRVIPATHRWAQVYISCTPSGDGSGWDGYWDNIELRPVGGSAFIADASILTAKIADLAVDNAKIASVNVGKLTAGILTADITVSSRIKTADSGARVELNSGGIEVYNSSGILKVDFDAASGNALIEGQLRTASTGRRMLLNSTINNDNSIRFYGDVGTAHALIWAPDYANDGNPSLYLRGDFPFGTANHPGMLLFADTARIGYMNGDLTGEGGYMVADADSLYLGDWGLGDLLAGFIFQDPGHVFGVGRFPQDFAGSGDSLLFVGTWNPGVAVTSVAVNYGVTMDSVPCVLLTPHNSTTALGDWRLQVRTSTGFTYVQTTTAVVNMQYWGYRVT